MTTAHTLAMPIELTGDLEIPDWTELGASALSSHSEAACSQRDPSHRFVCTRTDDHTGAHAAGNGDSIIAIWPREKQYVARFNVTVSVTTTGSYVGAREAAADLVRSMELSIGDDIEIRQPEQRYYPGVVQAVVHVSTLLESDATE